MNRAKILLPFALLFSPYIHGDELSPMDETLFFVPQETEVVATGFSPFTGKINANKVRLRIQPDLDSPVVQELAKDSLFVIVGEEEEFWAVEPPSSAKVYIFRSFVLDNTVEGSRVNVRLYPDLEAPIVAHLNTGDRVDGKVSSASAKWLEISPPSETRFYIAKDFIEKIGPADLKLQMDQRLTSAADKLKSLSSEAQTELAKEFSEIDTEKVAKAYQDMIEEYKEFPSKVAQAKQDLTSFQENFLQKKIDYLEQQSRAKVTIALEKTPTAVKPQAEEQIASLESSTDVTDKMRLWAPVEQALYQSWASVNQQASVDDFYIDQKLAAIPLEGIVEAFNAPVKSKPGDYLIKVNDVPVAYVYSTEINLQAKVGQKVRLKGIPRSNHHFAFPAYFVYEPEE